MTVAEIINALIGVPGDVEVEVCDVDGIAAAMDRIKISHTYGNTYAVAEIDRLLVADNESVARS